MNLFRTKYLIRVISAILCFWLMTSCDSGAKVQPSDLENHLTTQILPSVPIRNCEQPVDPKSNPSNHIVCRALVKKK